MTAIAAAGGRAVRDGGRAVPAADADAALVRAHRDEWPRVVGALVRRFGDLDVAEDAAAEAFATAVERWPADGVPQNPGGWLTITATRKALDRLRRDGRRADRYREAGMRSADDAPAAADGTIEDDRLRLLLTCCHPVLPAEARIAVTLRMVGGLTVPEIARAFLVQESTMGQRISRAKSRIRASGVPYLVPSEEELPERLSGVLAVVLLIFNEGYLASGAGEPIRADLALEAIRLARLLHDLLPGDGEVSGLLALLLLTDARRGARLDISGGLVTLDRQDRTTWDRGLIVEGLRVLQVATSAPGRPGRYRVLAAIAAIHATALAAEDTDWREVLALYDLLVELDPSPIVALNRAVALAEVDGPASALVIVDGLGADLEAYPPALAVRADLLRRLGRLEEATVVHDRALASTENVAARTYLGARRDETARARDASPGVTARRR